MRAGRHRFRRPGRFQRFTLIAHSLGGVTITETALRHPKRVAQLIYVAADVPGPGQNASILHAGADWPPDQPVTIEESITKAIFGNDLTDEQWTEVWQGFVPDAANLMNAPLSGYPRDVPITYISMTDDIPVPSTLVAQMSANLGAAVDHRVLSAGHLVMMSKPQELAAIINEVVDS